MCSLNCEIVKEAIKQHETRGICMHEFIDYHKHYNVKCLMCERNEYKEVKQNEKKNNK